MMTRDQYAAAVAGDTAKSAAYVRDHIARQPRQMTAEQEFALSARQIASDLTRHRRANERARDLLAKADSDLLHDNDPMKARKRIEQAIRALYRAEAPAIENPGYRRP